MEDDYSIGDGCGGYRELINATEEGRNSIRLVGTYTEALHAFALSFGAATTAECTTPHRWSTGS